MAHATSVRFTSLRSPRQQKVTLVLRKCQHVPKKTLELNAWGSPQLRASSAQPFRRVNSPKSTVPTETTRDGAPSKNPAADQKNHHPTGHSFVATNHLKLLHPQTLRSKSPKRRTMHILGMNLPENQHAMARCLLVGLERWERRLRRNVCIPNMS